MDKIAKFHKISKTIDNSYYIDNVELPRRATKGSAGYDFFMPYDAVIEPNETIKILSGIRCEMDENYCLLIFPRSGLGNKYKLSLDNTVGVIDSDYYHADNEGHIMIQMTNHSNNILELKKGDRFAQGIFVRIGVAIDDNVIEERKGGFGSTGK